MVKQVLSKDLCVLVDSITITIPYVDCCNDDNFIKSILSYEGNDDHHLTSMAPTGNAQTPITKTGVSHRTYSKQ